jgi:hypothetical protein
MNWSAVERAAIMGYDTHSCPSPLRSNLIKYLVVKAEGLEIEKTVEKQRKFLKWLTPTSKI